MSKYVVLARFTQQGIKGVKETTKRASAFRKMAQEFGGKVRDIYWTLGSYDVVLTLEAPNDEAAAALMTKAGSLGNLTSQTLRAFDESEMESIVSKV